MRCRTAQPLISLDLDGRLSVKEASALAEHLSGCEACQATRQAMAGAWDLLGASPAVAAPDDWRSIAARIEVPRSGLRSWLGELWVATPGRWATAGALAVFLVVGGAAGLWLAKGLKPSMPVEAVAMAEAFGDVPGSVWLASEGQVRP